MRWAKVSSESQFNNKLWQPAEASLVQSLPIVRLQVNRDHSVFTLLLHWKSHTHAHTHTHTVGGTYPVCDFITWLLGLLSLSREAKVTVSQLNAHCGDTRSNEGATFQALNVLTKSSKHDFRPQLRFLTPRILKIRKGLVVDENLHNRQQHMKKIVRLW